MDYETITGVKFQLPAFLLRGELEPNLSLLSEMPKHSILTTGTKYTEADIKGKPEIAGRAKLAIEFFSRARSLGYTVLAVDGGSDSGWRASARDLGVILIDENLDKFPGKHPIGRSRRQVFAEALNHSSNFPLITWCEPEKITYITSSDGRNPISMAATPVYEGLADVVLPRRIDTSYYPATQQAIELFCNLLCMKQVREYLRSKGLPEQEATKCVPYLDEWCGPRTFNRESAQKYWVEYTGEINGKPFDRWEPMNVAVWNMLIDGKRVRSVAVPYEHPAAQTALEDRSIAYDLKRIEQAQFPLSALAELIGSKVQAAT
ncbi:MAG: hypothetical protein AABY00_01945 [Nanoarchaeota archaeon]